MPSSQILQVPVALLVKNNCPLCVSAQEVATVAAQEHELPLAVVHLEDHPELGGEYGEEIPVLFVDGVQRDFWVLDPERVRSLLGARA